VVLGIQLCDIFDVLKFASNSEGEDCKFILTPSSPHSIETSVDIWVGLFCLPSLSLFIDSVGAAAAAATALCAILLIEVASSVVAAGAPLLADLPAADGVQVGHLLPLLLLLLVVRVRVRVGVVVPLLSRILYGMRQFPLAALRAIHWGGRGSILGSLSAPASTVATGRGRTAALTGVVGRRNTDLVTERHLPTATRTTHDGGR